MLHPAHKRAPADVAPQAGTAAAPIDTGVYLTDEVFLYRVVGSLTDAVDEVVALEDCCGLDVVPVHVSHLRSRRLRVVTPAVEG